jgi:hypothetical protein
MERLKTGQLERLKLGWRNLRICSEFSRSIFLAAGVGCGVKSIGLNSEIYGTHTRSMTDRLTDLDYTHLLVLHTHSFLNFIYCFKQKKHTFIFIFIHAHPQYDRLQTHKYTHTLVLHTYTHTLTSTNDVLLIQTDSQPHYVVVHMIIIYMHILTSIHECTHIHTLTTIHESQSWPLYLVHHAHFIGWA